MTCTLYDRRFSTVNAGLALTTHVLRDPVIVEEREERLRLGAHDGVVQCTVEAPIVAAQARSIVRDAAHGVVCPDQKIPECPQHGSGDLHPYPGRLTSDSQFGANVTLVSSYF